jgi:hypothetical protein
MAQIKKQVLGQNRGSIADVVFRKNGDGTFTSAKPGSYKLNDTPDKLLIKQKFRLAVKTASAVNGISALKGLWPHDSGKRQSRFNEIVKMNFGLIAGPDMSGSFALTYELGFHLVNTEIFASSNNVAITANAIGTGAGIDDNVEKFIAAKGILVLANPTDPRAAKPIYVIKVESGMQALDLQAEINMNILLDPREAQLIDMYSVKKAYLAILTTKQSGEVVHFSNTYGNV